MCMLSSIPDTVDDGRFIAVRCAFSKSTLLGQRAFSINQRAFYVCQRAFSINQRVSCIG